MHLRIQKRRGEHLSWTDAGQGPKSQQKIMAGRPKDSLPMRRDLKPARGTAGRVSIGAEQGSTSKLRERIPDRRRASGKPGLFKFKTCMLS